MIDLPVSFDDHGLIPVVVQDDATGAVLMLAYMNSEALERTWSTGRMHYWSRSRQALWKKGETSGNEQVVKSIHVNCYDNTLLARVEQLGVCCHTGYPTCFYRELAADGTLVTHGEPLFDPEEVYGKAESLQADLVRWLGAYRWLAEHDLASVSGTSRLLHEAAPAYLATRVSDELRELTGVLTGEHRHESVEHDLALESTQVLYWAALFAIRSGIADAETVDAFEAGMLAGISEPSGQLLEIARNLAADWDVPGRGPADVLVRTGGVVAAAASAAGTAAHHLVLQDLNDLRSRPYLSSYFQTQR